MSGTNGVIYFDLVYVREKFTSSLLEDGDIDLKHYLDSYKELQKFCDILGSVFGFVASEISSKSGIMYELRAKDTEAYRTLNTMVDHEISNELLKDQSFVNGSRTLLRLHRGLAFIKEFLKEISGLESSASTASVGHKAYSTTLAVYHPWYIKAGAWLAMAGLPTKEVLFRKVAGDYSDDQMDLLPRAIEVMEKVYQITHSCYERHNLLDLP